MAMGLLFRVACQSGWYASVSTTQPGAVAITSNSTRSGEYVVALTLSVRGPPPRNASMLPGSVLVTGVPLSRITVWRGSTWNNRSASTVSTRLSSILDSWTRYARGKAFLLRYISRLGYFCIRSHLASFWYIVVGLVTWSAAPVRS